MTEDFRLAVDWADHPKTEKLCRRLGDGAARCLLRLWGWVTKRRPTGILDGLDAEDIEIAAGWRGEAGAFATALEDLRWLDRAEGGTLSLHQWAEHETWVAGAAQRSESARRAAEARWAGRGAAVAQCGTDADRMPGASAPHPLRNAPSPSPSPSPESKTTPPEGECAQARPPLVDAHASGEAEGGGGGNVDNPGQATEEPPDGEVLALWWRQRYREATGTGPTLAAKTKLLLATRCLDQGLPEVKRRLEVALERGKRAPKWLDLAFALRVAWDELGAPAPADRPGRGDGPGPGEIDRAWKAVVARAAKVGAYTTPSWDDQVLARAVKAVGWGSICRASPHDRAALRARFEYAYQEARTAATAEEGVGG